MHKFFQAKTHGEVNVLKAKEEAAVAERQATNAPNPTRSQP